MLSAKPVQSNLPSKTIYFVRHGETESNAAGLLSGSRDDTPLTLNGRTQAQDVAALVAALSVELVVVSPLTRAQQTAHIIVRSTRYEGAVRTEKLFKERDFGSATGKPCEVGFALVDSGKADGLETLKDFHDRANACLNYLRARPEQHIMVVSHAGLARMVGAIVAGLKPEDFLQHPKLGNAEIYEFKLG